MHTPPPALQLSDVTAERQVEYPQGALMCVLLSKRKLTCKRRKKACIDLQNIKLRALI